MFLFKDNQYTKIQIYDYFLDGDAFSISCRNAC